MLIQDRNFTEKRDSIIDSSLVRYVRVINENVLVQI
jgi:hypothetical protein